MYVNGDRLSLAVVNLFLIVFAAGALELSSSSLFLPQMDGAVLIIETEPARRTRSDFGGSVGVEGIFC